MDIEKTKLKEIKAIREIMQKMCEAIEEADVTDAESGMSDFDDKKISTRSDANTKNGAVKQPVNTRPKIGFLDKYT